MSAPVSRQRIAAGAMVMQGDRLLLVHHHRPGVFDFWVPPGGGVTGAETLEAAAAREVREETAIEIEVVALAYIDELVISGTRQCKFWFLARTRSDALSIGGEAARAEHIVEAAFLSRAQLAGKTVFPHVVRDEFWRHLAEGFAQPRYLGVREAEIPYPSAR